MTELVSLCGQVAKIRWRSWDFKRQPLRYGKTTAFHGDEFSGIIAEKSDRNYSGFPQDLHADTENSLISLEPELFVGLHGIEPLVLRGICVNLIRQTAPSDCLPARRCLGAY
jgi:hypothetical protein